KHNIASASRPLRIDIRSTAEGLLEVTNNLQPKSSLQSSTGIGLDNIRQRYNLLFAREVSIVQTDNAFTVKLPLI
ncbi:MAG TPA: sensor histidine kinase, partial [Chitinophagaceae bacterium]|nr:sensor histidine kinase [Chitinophagaceae bacterium]